MSKKQIKVKVRVADQGAGNKESVVQEPRWRQVIREQEESFKEMRERKALYGGFPDFRVRDFEVRKKYEKILPRLLRETRTKEVQYRADMISFVEMFLDEFSLEVVLIGRDYKGNVHIVDCNGFRDPTDAPYDVEYQSEEDLPEKYK